FIVAGKAHGIACNNLSGTPQTDILKEFPVHNPYVYPPDPSMRIVSDIIAYCASEMPKFNSISISGYHMHEAGATAVQELAYTLADGMEYVRCAIADGLNIDDFAPRLSFFFGIGMNLFLEVATLRAALTTHISTRIARHTLQILAEQSGISAVADPLGGSFYVERLTRDLEERAWELIQEVEAHGGMTKAVAEGLPKHRIEEAAAARAAKVDTGETTIVGVNRYRLENEPAVDILEVDNAKVRSQQIAKIERVRARRDEDEVG